MLRKLLAMMAVVVSCLVAQAQNPINVAPPQADSVEVWSTGSNITTVTIVGDEYWKVTLAVDYIALGNRSIIAQVQNPSSGTWSMMHATPLPGQTQSGDAITVAAGQGWAKFTFYVKKDSGWGEYITAYGEVAPVEVWTGSYSGDTLKAEATGGVYR